MFIGIIEKFRGVVWSIGSVLDVGDVWYCV